METEYQVIVDYRPELRPAHAQVQQRWNPKTLDEMWQLVGRLRYMPAVKRVRVFAQLAVFEIERRK